MLHVIHMIQRRLGNRPGGYRLVARVLLGSLLVLVVGLGLLFSMRADAQEASEYAIPGHVDVQLIADVAAWVKAR